MRHLIALLLLIPTFARAQQIRSSLPPPYTLTASPTLTIPVGQFDEYNVLLTANGTIRFAVPVISNATILFRVNTCQNGTGGFAPTFTAVGSTTIVNRAGAVITTLTANACDTEEWSYRQETNQLILESVSFNTGSSLNFALTSAFGASGSQSSTTATTSAGSATVAVGSATSYSVGMSINIAGAGAASTMAGAATASATVGNCSASCGGTYSYVCVPIDVFGGTTAKSTTSTISAAQNTTLSVTNYNDIQCGGITNAGSPSLTNWASYGVYRTTGGAAQGLIGYSSASAYGGSPYFKDTGLAVLSATVDGLPTAVPPNAPISDRYVGQVTAISGTTFTVSPATTTAVTAATALHDDTAAIQNALTACNSNGGGVVWLSPNGFSNITNSGNPLLAAMANKNLALLMYPNCGINGSGWGTGLKSQSGSVALYPINGAQYTGVTSTSTLSVVLNNFAIDGNKTALPLDDFYLGAGGAETVEVGLYPDNMVKSDFNQLLIMGTATDGLYVVNGSADWAFHDGRVSGAGSLSDQGLTYRDAVVGVGPTNWTIKNNLLDSANGYGLIVQSESPGSQTQEGRIAGNIIRNNGNYGMFLGDSACGNTTQTLSNLTVIGNSIYSNIGGVVIQGIGNGACTETTKQILFANNDVYNNGASNSGLLILTSKNGGTTGIVQDVQVLDNYFHLDGSQSLAAIALNAGGASSILRTIINGNSFGNYSTSGLISDGGAASSTNTVMGCNYTQVAGVWECSGYNQGGTVFGSMEHDQSVLTANLNGNTHKVTGLIAGGNSGEALSFAQSLTGANGCAGTVNLSSGTPSTATVSNACVTTGCRPSCTDETSVSAIKCSPTSSTLTLTGPNTVTDTIAWSCQ